MTLDGLLALVRAAGVDAVLEGCVIDTVDAAVAAEREACAALCDALEAECYEHAGTLFSTAAGARCADLAVAIRARPTS